MSAPNDDIASLEAQLAQVSLEEPVDFDRSVPSFEPLTKSPTFVAEEHNSPIALLNNHFFEDQAKKDNFAFMYARAMKWAAGADVDEAVAVETGIAFTEHIVKFNAEKKQFERIFIRDGERSFNEPKHRIALCHALTFLQERVLNNDYHQGLSMIVSFLMCFLPLPHVLAMIIKAQKSLITDVWRSQSVVAATDGYVFEKILSEEYPAVFTHLRKHYVIPELYTSKYWCAFALHILPFQSLSVLFDQFWCGEGVLALFRLMLLVVASQEKAILAANGTDTVLELMSLDHKVLTASHVNRIIYNVDADGVAATEHSEEEAAYRNKVEKIVDSLRDKDVLQAKRTEAYTVNILPRVARATADFAKEKTPDCGREECSNREEQGFYYCLQCKIHLCEDCAYSAWGDHNDDDHDVRMNEDLDDEE